MQETDRQTARSIIRIGGVVQLIVLVVFIHSNVVGRTIFDLFAVSILGWSDGVRWMMDPGSTANV